MTNENGNGRTTLSATDFLGLAARKKVARVDLSETGTPGIVYVCGLSASQQQEIMGLARGSRVRAGEGWTEFDSSALHNNQAGAKFLEACVVTDTEGGAVLERAFAAIEEDGEGADYVTIAKSELVWMAKTWIKELGGREKMLATLGEMDNDVISLIVKTVRRLSGMGSDEEIEEKKGNS